MTAIRHILLSALLLIAALATPAHAESRFPPPEFRTPHTMPVDHYPAARAAWWNAIDLSALILALALIAYFALRRRSRWGVFATTAAALAYFGFYRAGCVCPIGAIQNVAHSAFTGEPLPWLVAAFFALPLIAALLAGRLFCGGVCPLGAIQDVVLLKPLRVPPWVDASLGLFAHAYLALAVLYAAVGSAYIICEWDPFVGFFRFSAPITMLLLGGGLLIASMFIGRVYCRWICPYSILLAALSPLARWQVHVSPKACIDCHLCHDACPYNAIDIPSPPARTADPRARRRLLLAVLALPLLTGVFTLGGYFAHTLLAQADRRIALAHEVHAARNLDLPPTDAVAAFRATGESPDALLARAATVQSQFALGSTLVGAYLGLVLSAKLIRHALPRRHTSYDANAANCLACARCFERCPVEHERRGLIPVTVSAPSRQLQEAAP